VLLPQRMPEGELARHDLYWAVQACSSRCCCCCCWDSRAKVLASSRHSHGWWGARRDLASAAACRQQHQEPQAARADAGVLPCLHAAWLLRLLPGQLLRLLAGRIPRPQQVWRQHPGRSVHDRLCCFGGGCSSCRRWHSLLSSSSRRR